MNIDPLFREDWVRPVGVDLFAGAGGMSLGFELAGFDVAAAVDFDPVHCASHEFNFPLCKPLCRDVSNLDGTAIRHLARLGDRNIAVVFGGSPCQGFSVIGKRSSDDPRNQLVHHFVRLVAELQPAYYVFENVRGMMIGSAADLLDRMLKDLELAGYRTVSPFRVLNAADCGVPQNRHRLFLIGARLDCRLPCYPEAVVPRVTVRDAISDLPEVSEIPELLARDSVPVEFGDSSPYARRLRGMTKSPSDFGYQRAYDQSILTCSRRTQHGERQRARFRELPVGHRDPVSRLDRLDPDGFSTALRSGTASDRGSYTSPRPIHPFEPRCITVREAARLHSYPDWFRFHVTKWHGLRQIGNSVPPLFAQAVGAVILRALGTVPTVPTRILQLGDPTLLTMSMREASAHYGFPDNVIPSRNQAVSTPNDPLVILQDGLAAEQGNSKNQSETTVGNS